LLILDLFLSEEQQIKDHTRQIKQLQNELVKINGLLSQQTNSSTKLEEKNMELEHQFRSKLKEAQLESLQLELSLENLKSEKSKALKGLVDAE
jgi:hypothetical protein